LNHLPYISFILVFSHYIISNGNVFPIHISLKSHFKELDKAIFHSSTYKSATIVYFKHQMCCPILTLKDIAHFDPNLVLVHHLCLTKRFAPVVDWLFNRSCSIKFTLLCWGKEVFGLHITFLLCFSIFVTITNDILIENVQFFRIYLYSHFKLLCRTFFHSRTKLPKTIIVSPLYLRPSNKLSKDAICWILPRYYHPFILISVLKKAHIYHQQSVNIKMGVQMFICLLVCGG